MEIREFLTQIAQLRVARSSGDEIAAYCPWHDDQNASLAINHLKGMYHCFGGCVKGSGGLVGLFDKLDETGAVSSRYIQLFAIDAVRAFPKPVREIDPTSHLDDGYDVMELPLALENEYLGSRGISDDTVRKFGLRYHLDDNCIVIPIIMKEKLVGYKRRNISTNPKYLNSSGLTRDTIVYPFDLFESNNNTIYVCEGPFDAITISGVSILGSEINDVQQELINNLNRQVIVVPDRDAPGEKLINQAIEFGWNVAFPEWDNKVEDVADAVLKYGRLFTIQSILKSTESSKLKIDLKRKMYG